MTANDRLDEIKARADNATDGPWAARHRAGLDWLSHSPHVDIDGHEPGSSVGLADAVDPLWGSLWPSRNATADAEFIAHSRTDVPALAASLRAVIELHKPYPDEGMGWREDHTYGYVGIVCATCGTPDEYGVPWPCGTVRAVEAALGEVAP